MWGGASSFLLKLFFTHDSRTLPGFALPDVSTTLLFGGQLAVCDVRLRTGHAPATFRSIKAFIQLLLQSELSHLHPSSCVCSNRCSALVTQRFLNRPGILPSASTTSLHNASRCGHSSNVSAGRTNWAAILIVEAFITEIKKEDITDLIAQLAQSSQQLSDTVPGLTSSQSSFMRSAAGADANIALSKSHSLLPVEIVDNTVNDDHRNGPPASLRDLRAKAPDDYNGVVGSDGYDTADPRHAIATTYGAEHDDFAEDRSNRLQSWHRNRGRGIRQLEKQSPADGYMNTVTPTVAHPDRSGFEGTPTEESDAINPLIDQLPLSNFMTEVEPVDDFFVLDLVTMRLNPSL